MTVGGLIILVIVLASEWMIYKKMGREGWEGIVPIYNLYVLCEKLYGKGWKFLLLLIPVYNIYFIFKLMIDWAHAFNKSSGFGVGMAFFPYIFYAILGFSKNAVYGDGSQANTSQDFVSNAFDKASDAVSDMGIGKDDQAIEKIKELQALKEQGIITEEEFETKKAELLKRI